MAVVNPVLPIPVGALVQTVDAVPPVAHGVPANTPWSVPVHHAASDGMPALASDDSNTGVLRNMLLHDDAMRAPFGPYTDAAAYEELGVRSFMLVLLPEINALVVEHVMSHVVDGETAAQSASAAA